MLDEGEDTVVLHVPRLTESLLQLLLHILLAVQKINLGVLRAKDILSPSPKLLPRKLMLELLHLLKTPCEWGGRVHLPWEAPQSPLSPARSRTNLF